MTGLSVDFVVITLNKISVGRYVSVALFVRLGGSLVLQRVGVTNHSFWCPDVPPRTNFILNDLSQNKHLNRG